MNKVLFLDIDGVLNNRKTTRSIKGMMRRGMDPVNIPFLIDIIDATGCKIVVSSNWRISFGAQPFNKNSDYFVELQALGGQKIIDATIDRTHCVLDNDCPPFHGRAQEIQYWLDTNHGYDRIAVLDDIYFDHKLTKHLFLTDDNYGLTKDIADKVINHLNKL